MAEATATIIFKRAGIPKIIMPKIDTGARAMSMLRINAVELTGEAICGLDCNNRGEIFCPSVFLTSII
jgi:hypothetical protein